MPPIGIKTSKWDMIDFRRPHKDVAMENGIIIYLEDTEGGNIRVLGKVVGNPNQSRELADEIMLNLVADSTTLDAPTSLQ